MRHCSKPGCPGSAVGTLTYDYHSSTAVLGPLATTAEPHSYDLCAKHLDNLTVPRGWEVVRLEINYDAAPPSDDDLMALVDAVREAAEHAVPSGFVGGGQHGFSAFNSEGQTNSAVPSREERRGHFTVVQGRETDGDVPEPKEHLGAPTTERGPFAAKQNDIPEGS